jgi:hypothetical protein
VGVDLGSCWSRATRAFFEAAGWDVNGSTPLQSVAIAARGLSTPVAVLFVLILAGVPLSGCSTHAASVASTSRPVVGCDQLTSSARATSTEGHVAVDSAKVTNINGASFCEVRGTISSTLRFDLRMPTSTWTGRYVQEGCGGYCGVIHPGPPDLSTGCPAVAGNELALATDDEGHTSSSSTDGQWAANNPAARVSFGYTSEHELALASKALMTRYYGREPKYSYFDGCSDGGREALVEAQRYPHDFNGILAGAPGNIESELNGEFEDWLIQANTDGSGHEILTSEKVPALHQAVVKACGGADGYIVDPRRCDFNPAAIECAAGTDDDQCLTSAQVAAVDRIYRGPSDANGQSLYPGGEPYGSELAWAGWFVDGASDRAWPTDTPAYQFASGFLRYMTKQGNPASSFKLSQFQFDLADYKNLTTLDDTYDAIDPDLSAFAKSGGKILMYQGWADQAIPPFGTVAYYGAVVDESGGFLASQQFSRLYMIPAQYHCLAGGDPQVTGDLLGPLMKWVERGTTPGDLRFPLVQPTPTLKAISVSPLNPLVQAAEGPSALNAHYAWVGSFPTPSANQ